jgi:prepilin-type N-terminal cleavage/methylation domain-containing protein
MKIVVNLRKKGFTLVELLVVISIIALLLSITMPGLQRAREQAKRTVCRSNLKSLGLAFHLYGNDWKNFLPPWWEKDSIGRPMIHPCKLDCLTELNASGGDRGLIFPRYINNPNIFFCPNNNWVKVPKNNPAGWPGWNPSYGGHNVTLSYMYMGGGQPVIELKNYNIGKRMVSARKLTDRGSLPIMQDLLWEEWSGNRRVGSSYVNHTRTGPANSYTGTSINKAEADGANILLLGGSVHWRSISRLREEGIANMSTTRMFYATD